MSVLTGLVAVKGLANIAASDARWDAVLNLLRERASRDVEDMTGRQFTKAERTEFFPSYEQSWGDPTPQWLFPNAPPIDTAQATTLVWAPYDDHANNGATLVQDSDWRFEVANDGTTVGIRVQRFSSFPANFPLPAGGGDILRDSPTGFQLTYTGGYTGSGGAADPPAGENRDPYVDGESDVVAVPSALSGVVTQKVAADFQYLMQQRGRLAQGAGRGDAEVTVAILQTGAVLPWNALQRQVVMQFARKDVSWARPGAQLPRTSRTMGVQG